MGLRYKILGSILLVVTLALLSLAIALSHNSPCGPVPPLAGAATPMNTIVHHCYGSADVIRYQQVAKPTPADDLTTPAGLMQSGKVTPVIDRTYAISNTADAVRYLEKGHARGKVVITVD